MEKVGENNNQGSSPDAGKWDNLGSRGKFVKGPDGKLIPEDQLDAAMEAHERAEGAKEHEALVAHLGEMEANPDQFEQFKGENKRGASARNEEYMTINTGKNGMYAAAPDGTPLNNAKRQEMARMMHDAEDLQSFEEDTKYKDYIAREREKIGTVYKSQDDFNHRVVERIKTLNLKKEAAPADDNVITIPPEDIEIIIPGKEIKPQQPHNSTSFDDIITIPPVRDSAPQLPKANSGDKPQLPGPEANKPQLNGPNQGDIPQLPGPKQVEIGEINIEGIDQNFKEIKAEEITKAEESLKTLRPQVAELYAKNRRLIVGGENRAEFRRIKGEYDAILDRCLRLKAGEAYEKGKHEISNKIESRIEELRKEIEHDLTEFAGGSLEHSEKTQEEIDAEKARLAKEAEETLRKEYNEEIEALKAEINADFVADFIKEETALESATVDALDNGSICRRFVSKVLNNKVLKKALIAASVAGLAVTGLGLAGGLAAGTLAISSSYTVGGVALGAAKGAFSGLVMSRQNSDSSAVHNFVSEDEIKKQLEDIDVTKEDADTSNVAGWLLDQYSKANTADAKSNRKRTLVASGLGAAVGGLMSGINVSNRTQEYKSYIKDTGERQPVEYHITKMEEVDIPKGRGVFEYFKQLGGNPENNQKALEIAQSLDQKYGILSDINGIQAPVGNAVDIYPGKLSSWPDVAQSWATEMAEEWAKKGLIDFRTTGGEPIYTTAIKLVESKFPNAIANFFAHKIAPIGTGILAGTVARNKPDVTKTDDDSKESSQDASSASSSSESAPVIDNEALERRKKEFEEKISDLIKSYYDSLSSEQLEKLLQDLRERPELS